MTTRRSAIGRPRPCHARAAAEAPGPAQAGPGLPRHPHQPGRVRTAKPTLQPLRGLVVWLACHAAAAAGGALPLADPTRPPAVVAVVPAAARAAAALLAAPALVLPPPQVQALKLPQRGVASALVDGVWINVGDLLQGRRVLDIDAAGLLWQGRGGDQRLPLLAGTAKQVPGSITIDRSARYVPAATVDGSAKGLADAGPGLPSGAVSAQPAGDPPGRSPGASPGAPAGQAEDKEQPLSVAGRISR